MDKINYELLIEVFVLANIFLWVLYWSLKWTAQSKKGITPSVNNMLPNINPIGNFIKKVKNKDDEIKRSTEREALG